MKLKYTNYRLVNGLPQPRLFKNSGQYTDASGALKTAPFQPADIEKYADGSDPWGHPNTDWFKTTLRDWALSRATMFNCLAVPKM